MAASSDTPRYVANGGELRLGNPAQLELLRGVTERGAPLHTPVRGFSMMPFIRDGDVVTFAPVRDAPEVGQVVAVALPAGGRMAVHRVVARCGERWLVRGDNCPEADGAFDAEAFVGRVVRVERGGREVSRGVRGSAACIAALSRTGWLARLREAWRVSRRAAGSALHAAQGLPAYRRAGRRLAPRVVVREATGADLAAVSRRFGVVLTGAPARAPGGPGGPLAASGGATGGASRGSSQQVVRWVADCRGRTAGFVELVVRGVESAPWDGVWLHSLVVWTPFRCLGVGEALTRKVLARACAEGSDDVLLAVYEDNRQAVALYGKLGFVPHVVEALIPSLAREAQATGRPRVVLRAATGGLDG